MSTQEQEMADRQRAWAALSAVEDHPRIQDWLRKSNGRARSSKWPRAIAASILIATLTVAAYFYFVPQHYTTGIGEQRDVLLQDGSRVTLNTHTKIAVRYSQARRFIELEQGEALFAVKHEASRPFEVAAGDTLTRALGTEFNVDLRGSKVTVSVLEGAVRVTDASTADPPGVALAKGQAVEFRAQKLQAYKEKADLKRIDAWRTRRLEFSDTPLAQAVEEFNRYSTTRITIATPELQTVRVSGVFRIGDADGFLFSLKEALGVKPHASQGEVVLMR